MVFEICAESFEAMALARKYKVKRVELCSALSLGGLTPSRGLIEKCASVKEVEVHVMIRHKEGGFVYSPNDIEIMRRDILTAKEAGARGVVFGCLTAINEIDIEQSKGLFKLAKDQGLEVTFHRAFDFCIDPEKALEQLISIGFDRVLTSGQALTVDKGIELITHLTRKADGRIQVMAGSGVNVGNAIKLAQTGVDALHFSIHKKTNEVAQLGMGSSTILDEDKVKSIVQQF